MKKINLKLLTATICLLICTVAFVSFKRNAGSTKAAIPVQKCLIVSDMHFSPIYASTENDTVLKKKLENSSYDEWIKYFESTPAQMALDSTLMFKDSNYALLRSAIANMKKRLPRPAFIVIAGDFLWHGAIPADSVLKKRTIQFITHLFKHYFPGSLIIPAMGNNDTYGQDYSLQDRKFLKDFATAWEPNLPDNSADSLKKQGYYTCDAGNMRFIVLNTAPLNAGTTYPEGPAELNWLNNALANANGKNIWLIMHIPPGLNSYNQKDFWNKPVNDAFTDAVVKYAGNIKLTIASHTHFEDFKVIYNNAATPAPVSLIRIVPSVCPNHGNYPSFDVAEVNTSSGKVVNEVNWYLNLSKSHTGQHPEQVVWVDSLNLKQDLGLNDLSANSFSQLISNIKADPSGPALKNYAFVTSVAAPTGAMLLNINSYMNYLKADSLKQK